MASYTSRQSLLFTAALPFDSDMLHLVQNHPDIESKIPHCSEMEIDFDIHALPLNSLSCVCDWHPGGSLLQPGGRLDLLFVNCP